MKKEKMFYGWWIVIAILTNVALLGPAAVALANLFQTAVTTEFGITNSAFAINNMIVLGIGIFISPIVSKYLAGPHFKKTYLMGIASYIIGLVGYSISQNIYMFYFFSLFIGIGFITSTMIPASLLINNWFVEKRGLALSIALSGLGVGGFVLSPVITILITNIQWRMTYLIYAITIAVVVIPITIFLLKFKPEDIGLQALGAEEANSKTNSGENVNDGKVSLSVKDSKTKLFFIALIGGSLIIGLVNNGGLGQFPPSITIQHGPVFSSIIVSLYSIVGIAGKLILGQVTDKYGVRVSVIYTTIGIAIAYSLMMFSDVQLNVYLMAIFFGISNANATVLAPLLTNSIFPAKEYSGAFGFVQSGQQLGMAIGSLAVAGIADASGGYTASWLVMAILGLAGGLSWLVAISNSKKYVK